MWWDQWREDIRGTEGSNCRLVQWNGCCWGGIGSPVSWYPAFGYFCQWKPLTCQWEHHQVPTEQRHHTDSAANLIADCKTVRLYCLSCRDSASINSLCWKQDYWLILPNDWRTLGDLNRANARNSQQKWGGVAKFKYRNKVKCNIKRNVATMWSASAGHMSPSEGKEPTRHLEVSSVSRGSVCSRTHLAARCLRPHVSAISNRTTIL